MLRKVSTVTGTSKREQVVEMKLPFVQETHYGATRIAIADRECPTNTYENDCERTHAMTIRGMVKTDRRHAETRFHSTAVGIDSRNAAQKHYADQC